MRAERGGVFTDAGGRRWLLSLLSPHQSASPAVSGGQAEVLLVGGKARFGLAVPAAEPLRLTCGRDTRPFAAEFEVPADCLPVTGCR